MSYATDPTLVGQIQVMANTPYELREDELDKAVVILAETIHAIKKEKANGNAG